MPQIAGDQMRCTRLDGSRKNRLILIRKVHAHLRQPQIGHDVHATDEFGETRSLSVGREVAPRFLDRVAGRYENDALLQRRLSGLSDR